MGLLIETIPWWIWLLFMTCATYSLVKWLIVTEKNTYWLWRLLLGVSGAALFFSFIIHRMILDTGYLKKYLPILDNMAMPMVLTVLIIILFYPISEERKKLNHKQVFIGRTLLILSITLYIILSNYDYIASFFK